MNAIIIPFYNGKANPQPVIVQNELPWPAIRAMTVSYTHLNIFVFSKSNLFHRFTLIPRIFLDFITSFVLKYVTETYKSEVDDFMELLYDIVIRLVENVPGDPSAFAKCLSPLLSDNCYQALSQIKAVLEDDSLDDRECFMKIERCV